MNYMDDKHNIINFLKEGNRYCGGGCVVSGDSRVYMPTKDGNLVLTSSIPFSGICVGRAPGTEPNGDARTAVIIRNENFLPYSDLRASTIENPLEDCPNDFGALKEALVSRDSTS